MRNIFNNLDVTQAPFNCSTGLKSKNELCIRKREIASNRVKQIVQKQLFIDAKDKALKDVENKTKAVKNAQADVGKETENVEVATSNNNINKEKLKKAKDNFTTDFPFLKDVASICNEWENIGKIEDKKKAVKARDAFWKKYPILNTGAQSAYPINQINKKEIEVKKTTASEKAAKIALETANTGLETANTGLATANTNVTKAQEKADRMDEVLSINYLNGIENDQQISDLDAKLTANNCGNIVPCTF